MCRNIRVLHNFAPPTTPDEIRAAALAVRAQGQRPAQAAAGRPRRLRRRHRRRHRRHHDAARGADLARQRAHARRRARQSAASLADATSVTRASLAAIARLRRCVRRRHPSCARCRGKETPLRELLRLAWPIAVSMLSYSIMTLVDTLLVGRLGPAALAGVGLGGTAAFALLCFSFGLIRGTKTLVSQAVGAGRRDLVPRIARPRSHRGRRRRRHDRGRAGWSRRCWRTWRRRRRPARRRRATCASATWRRR